MVLDSCCHVLWFYWGNICGDAVLRGMGIASDRGRPPRFWKPRRSWGGAAIQLISPASGGSKPLSRWYSMRDRPQLHRRVTQCDRRVTRFDRDRPQLHRRVTRCDRHVTRFDRDRPQLHRRVTRFDRCVTRFDRDRPQLHRRVTQCDRHVTRFDRDRPQLHRHATDIAGRLYWSTQVIEKGISTQIKCFRL